MEGLKSKLIVAIKDINAEIIDVQWQISNGNKILQVVIEGINQAVDLDLCTAVSSAIDNIVDESIVDEDYFLEVCSGGINKALSTPEARLENLGKYVLVKFKQPILKLMEVQGTLEFENDQYKITTFVKGAKKTFKFNDENIADMQLSVKI
ncbi:MAG: hypothetical protein ACK5G7_04750 [Erysipelotrichaceae bacterium]